MIWPSTLIIPLMVFFVSMIGTRLLIGFLTRGQALDIPNARSSHSVPIPSGGGIAVIGALLVAWFLVGQINGSEGKSVQFIAGMGFILAGISWLDDIQGLSPGFRLLTHVAVVIGGMLVVPFPGLIFGGLVPPWLDMVLTAVVWIWFINLFNFMDGIDGLAGVGAVTIAAGLFVITRKLGLGEQQMILSLCLGAAALGFLRWNWHPAKIFLGDVGSIPLGYVLGWMLLNLAAAGAWAPAVILPLYFLADATLTLLRRLLRRERVWYAHREHCYQLAVRSGLRHDQVSWIVGVANLFLIMLAIVAARGLNEAALLGAIGAVAMLMFLLVKGGPTD